MSLDIVLLYYSYRALANQANYIFIVLHNEVLYTPLIVELAPFAVNLPFLTCGHLNFVKLLRITACTHKVRSRNTVPLPEGPEHGKFYTMHIVLQQWAVVTVL